MTGEAGKKIFHIYASGLWTLPPDFIIQPSPSGRWFPAAQWAQIAQLVEHATENRSVGGSNPPLGTIYFLEMSGVFGGR